jgi:ankyrin repeat protein
MAAASIGNTRIVEFLIDKGANVHSAHGYYGNLPQTTSFLGHTEIVEILLKNGVDVDAEK